MKQLLKIEGFLPYIFVVFLNAFTDLGHKIIIQNTVFKVYDSSEQVILTAIVNGLMLLPFILLFSPSGFISDRFEKHKIMRVSAIAAVVITLCITLSYYMGLFWIAFGLTFALAIQSAIYSPAKYGYIKELIGNHNIASGNGAVQSTTIVAILLGILVYSIGFESLLLTSESYSNDEILKQIAPLGWFLVIGSLIELKYAYSLPNKSEDVTSKQFEIKEYIKGSYFKKNIKLISTNKTIWLSIVGLSIFWALSQVVLATYPAYIKEYLGVTNVIVVQGLMALSAIGIVTGSIIASKISKNYIEIGMVPVGSLGIFFTTLFIPILDSLFMHGINFFLFGVFGGLLIVPLNSLIQFNASTKRLGLILAGNNFVQNIAMITFLIATVFVTILSINTIGVFIILAIIAFLSSLYTIFKLPQSLIKFFIGSVFSFKYKLNVQGLDNVPQTNGVLLLGNHISWLDWAFVQLAMPRPIRFVMERSIYEQKFVKPFLDIFGVIPISSRGGRKSLEVVTKYLNDGEVVCIFPEGTISRTGHLGEFKRGFELAALKANATIIPFYIGGMWGTKFSRSNINFAELKQTKFTKDVIVSFGEAKEIKSKSSEIKQSVFELSVDSWNSYIKEFTSIDEVYINTVKEKGSNIALVDSSGDEYSYYKMFTLNILFKKFIEQNKEQNIGLLLPTTSIGAIINMSVVLANKTAVNINYTSSKESMASSVKQASIKTIYTAKRFVKKLLDKGIDIENTFSSDVKLIYLEDLKSQISKVDYIATYTFVRFAPTSIVQQRYKTTNTLKTTAAILFSSGSEGSPKGVILSHKNLLANSKQITEMLNTTGNEVFLGSLPIFHAFGLTVTTLLPMIEGIKVVFHPDPTDAVGIGKAVAKYNVTFMCATATFIRLYTKNKKLTPIMFESLELIFSGAEKLNQDIAMQFKQKFGKTVLEGYGATECSPLISANIPNALDTKYWQTQLGTKAGTIGMPLPGCAVRIVDPNSLEELKTNEDGLIIASGPNVMEGYLNDPEKTSEALVEINNKIWYKTGDKGHIDEDGFITIVDRYSRFAKLGGEMVSLTAVENKIYEYLGDNNETKLVCVNIPDDKKGEKIVLVIDKEIENLKQELISFQINPLWLPSEIKVVEHIPILGTGKIDFKTAKTQVLETLNI
ncbi:MAG: acyl-[ACP]--phospholipid O-acyltransferase [Campylobacterota bacterium]|nr:acyl-[ACP]--phospholipid O-acyltransferase [Campylobacterota bacterium]